MKRILIFLAAAVLVATSVAAADAKPYTRNVAIVLYNGVEILDFSGPAEVFAAAGNIGRYDSAKAFNVYTVSRTREPIVSQGFIDVVPDYSIDDAPKPDIVVFPGGGADSVIRDEKWMEWVRTTAAGSEHVLTVCTGAFIAGKAGLLEGLEATTWYNAIPGLAKEFPNTKVIPGRRFIDSGKIITTAGVSAGIDGALHLVARTLGRYIADRTAEYMEYKWSPESYLSARYPTLNPRLDARGKSLQQASMTWREGDAEGAMGIYRALLNADKNDAEASLQLARILHDQKRYREAIPLFEQASKGTAQRANALYNLTCALALTGEKDRAIETAARAIDSGFKYRAQYEQDEDLVSVRDDPRFKALMAKLSN